MWNFYCRKFYCAFSHKSLWIEIINFLKIIIWFLIFFPAQLSHFELKFTSNCIFFERKSWIESQRTKVRITGKIGDGLEFQTKIFILVPYFFGL